MLVTGGVHGYETSGVQGAIRFLDTRAEDFAENSTWSSRLAVALGIRAVAMERHGGGSEPIVRRESPRPRRSRQLMEFVDSLSVGPQGEE